MIWPALNGLPTRLSSMSKPRQKYVRKRDCACAAKIAACRRRGEPDSKSESAPRKLLALLRSEKPNFFELAEVVGKWVWIQFSDKQPPNVTSVLAELGFHWNNTRQAWQHPCGTIVEEPANYDPRKRYGSYFAADVKPA